MLKSPLSPINTKILSSQCSYKILNPIKIRNHSHNNNLIGLILNQSVDLELERKRQMEDFENRYRKIKLEEEKKQRLIEKIMYQKNLELEEIKKKKEEERKKSREIIEMEIKRKNEKQKQKKEEESKSKY